MLASYTDSCVRLWDFINMPCAVKKTYQGHVNEGYSIGGCFGVLYRRRPGISRKLMQNGDMGQEEEEPLNGEQQVEEQEEDYDSAPFVASASEDGDVVMWDVRSKEIVQRIPRAHSGVCFWVDVHSDSGTMVTCGDDMRIVVHRHRYPEPESGHANRDVNGKYPADEDDAADEEMREADFGAAAVQVNGNGHVHVEDLEDKRVEVEAEAAAGGDIPMSE